MVFTKPEILSRCKHYRCNRVILLTVLFLAACQSAPPKESEKDKTAESDRAQVEAPIERIPNPYEQAPKPEVASEAKSEYAKIKEAMEKKQWDKAEGLLSLMVETYPNLSGPYVNLGIVQRELKKFEDAEQAFKYAIEVNINNMDAYSQLGLLYREQGKFVDAEATYKKALEVWPHNKDVHVAIGILYDLYMGQFANAMAHYQMAQKISPEPDRKLKGWIVDLERRMKEIAAKQAPAEPSAEEQQ